MNTHKDKGEYNRCSSCGVVVNSAKDIKAVWIDEQKVFCGREKCLYYAMLTNHKGNTLLSK